MKSSHRLARIFSGLHEQHSVRVHRTHEREAMISALQITAP